MYAVTIQQEQFTIEKKGNDFLVNGQLIQWDIEQIDKRTFHLIHNGKSFSVELVSFNAPEKTLVLSFNNRKVTVQLKDKLDLLLQKLGMNLKTDHAVHHITAPMPGLIHDIKVSVGDSVQKGDPVLVLEAMKMENIIKSPGDGKVKKINVQKGDSVEKNTILIQF